jgi:hypothetical protein
MDAVERDKELAKASSWDELNQQLKEQLNISLDDMILALSVSVQEHSAELAEQFINIAPLGDYGELMDDKAKMSEFLKTEAHKPEHWVVFGMASDKNEITRFIFSNDAVDDGETFKGYVLVNSAGTIKHAFAQAEE